MKLAMLRVTLILLQSLFLRRLVPCSFTSALVYVGIKTASLRVHMNDLVTTLRTVCTCIDVGQ